MKEWLVDIKLTNWPIVIHDDGKYDAYGGQLDNRIERIMKVNARSLVKAISHKVGLIMEIVPSGFLLIL